ncbi:MAG TPA: MFS transporter [Pseudonocardiaceae bacterium]|nr:MFS transporter [Pseudonocardiaceae bacterium]
MIRRLSGAVRALVVANGVTSFGSSVTEFALPLVALGLLHASATTVAALYSVSLFAQAAASLPVGVWIDRTNRKRAMITGLLAGAAVVLCVPAAVATDRLSVGLLLLVALGAGLTTTVVQVAAQAMVPSLVEGPALVGANAGLSFGRSLGTFVGPGAGGLIVGLLGAGSALLFDGASQVLSALLLLRLPVPDRVPGPIERPRRAAKLGLQAVLQDTVLLRILIGTTLCNVGGGLIGSLYFPYAYRILRLTPVALGLAATIGNIGLLLGSAVAARVIGKLGIGRAGLVTITAGIAAFLLIPAAHYGPPLVLLTCYEFVFATMMSVFRVCTSTLRQRRTRPELQGRVFSVVLLGPMFGAPLGAVLATGMVALGLGVLGAIVVGIGISAASLAAYWLPGWLPATAPVDQAAT